MFSRLISQTNLVIDYKNFYRFQSLVITNHQRKPLNLAGKLRNDESLVVNVIIM